MSNTNDNKQPEPDRLKRGKQFHKKIQDDWQDAEGEVNVEKTVVKPSGRKGRVDVFVKADDELVAIAEIKNSDWDAMEDRAVRRNIKRQSRQIWSYIESQLVNGKDVSPGIISPMRPLTAGRLEIIERLFEEECIPVVWEDETIEERKARG